MRGQKRLVVRRNCFLPSRNQTIPARKKGPFCLEKPVLGRKSPFWPLKRAVSLTPHPSSRPAALAIDLRRHRLFAGCGNKLMVMLDYDTGKVAGSVPIAEGVDANAFDPGTQLAFASCGSGTTTSVSPFGEGWERVEGIEPFPLHVQNCVNSRETLYS